MELRAFAEKVLFSTCLEDKLAPPDSAITDDVPGEAITAPAAPGRDDSLRFSSTKGNGSFARARHLQSDEDRATLLHFFANHELLATELMALVLLRFPEAPREFRAGILATLREEQAHTRMYMRRMAACGVRFGEMPVNGFFWRNISGMGSPLDYVTRLSLTFEQANLDFAYHFAEVFRASGDTSTAGILEKIYRDEITHVGYGLQWFRRWKGTGLSDWEAFRRQLRFPLSPHRAKGKAPFNAAGRRAAGLDEEFIRELEVSTSSRGRTPHVYVFNPAAEESVALQSAEFTPSKDATTLACSLDTLALFLAREDDLVLLRRRPSTAFLHRVKQAGLPVPEIEVLDGEGMIARDSPNRERKIGALRPWGWSPDSVRLLRPFAGNAPREGSATGWVPAIAELYSKEWSARQLRALVATHPQLPLVTADDCGRCATIPREVVAHARAVLDRHPMAVLKAAFGVSGRGMLRVDATALHEERTSGWIANALRRHRALIVEPWLDRVLDFSMQYEVIRGRPGIEIVFKGGTHLVNDQRGQFRACKVSSQWIDSLPGEVSRFFNALPRHEGGWARSLYENLIPELLATALDATAFAGPLGIDAFVFRDAAGVLRLQPIVEVNPRFTFGRVAVELRRNLHPGSRGTLEIVPAAEVPADPALDTVRHGDRIKLRSGTLPLTEPGADCRFGAVWRVE